MFTRKKIKYYYTILNAIRVCDTSTFENIVNDMKSLNFLVRY